MPGAATKFAFVLTTDKDAAYLGAITCLVAACVAGISYYFLYVTLIISPVNGAVSIVIIAPEIV